jgi:iron complex transport system ATP-binding protein
MMQAGHIVGDGSKGDMLTAGRLQQLFGVEVELAERNGFYHAW